MPARNDIKKILIIGSGPIVIGQACEFDYSGNQAVQALEEEGYSVVVMNPNPASVMTMAERSDAVYMEPLDIEHLCAILDQEHPDAILPTMGGQSALNLTLEFYESNLQDKYNIEFIGASIHSIRTAEDRGLFKEKMQEIGLESPFSQLVKTEQEAYQVARKIGYPLIIRPSFTLGGQGGGIAYSSEDLKSKIRRALALSPTHSALIEESLLGYQEFEFEVVRDSKDNAIIVCSIENIDPMGIHTGDSITVAPIQTLSDSEYQMLRKISIDILRAVEVDCGGSNVQLAYHPETKRLLVIEMNPRVSRSSALASKATGFPIARCAAKLAVGFTLDEIINEITGKTTTFFEPSIDYVAVKVPRFDLRKFNIAELGTQMHSVGESLAIGRTFPEALNKAFRALELGMEGLEELKDIELSVLDNMVTTLHPRRIYAMYTLLLQKGAAIIPYLREKTHFHSWFLHYLLSIAKMERKLRTLASSSSDDISSFDINLLLEAKRMGMTDKRIARNTGYDIKSIYTLREENNIHAHYHRIDTCAGEFLAQTPYYYGTYGELDEDIALETPAVAIIGSGPNRIGQGLEFDTCCTMAALALRKQGYKVVMINCNPETVSTDFNISDRLYIEPLNNEDVYEVLYKEGINKVIFQLGGQTSINLLESLESKGIEILGGSSASVYEAEDREKFYKLIERLGLNQPPGLTVDSLDKVLETAEKVGYPVLVRPSYVIGGQSMMIAYTPETLEDFLETNKEHLKDMIILVDKFLENAIEYDVDAISDGVSVYIGGVLQHIEHAGIHSGDSACVFTNVVSTNDIVTQIYEATYKIATSLGGGVKGCMNIQFASVENKLYIIEVNPRASRTVPFISKSSGVNLVEMATLVWRGMSLAQNPMFQKHVLSHNQYISVGKSLENYVVKEAVFSFDRFEGIDPLLTPEMRSTGESIGIGDTFGEAFAKASASASAEIPIAGTIFISIAGDWREELLDIIDKFLGLGFALVGTQGTAKYYSELNRPCRSIYRVTDGSPNVIDEIHVGKIDLMINLLKPASRQSFIDDKEIRIAAVKNHIPYITTIPACKATIEGMYYLKHGQVRVRKLRVI